MLKPNKTHYKYLHYLVKIINVLAVVMAIWCLMNPPTQGNYGLRLSILIPFAIIVLLKIYNGQLFIFKVGENNASKLFYPILFLSVVLTINSFYHYFILDYKNVWLYGSILTLILLLIILFKTKEFNFRSVLDIFKIILISTLLLGYSCALIINLNCNRNTQSYIYFQTEVLKKEIIKLDKVPFYHIHLAPWEKKGEISDLKIENNLYFSVEIGQKIQVKYYDGKFGIPWYEIEY